MSSDSPNSPDAEANRLSQIQTLWSVVRRASADECSLTMDARGALLERYGGAVKRYLMASLRNPDAADEVFQQFALKFVRGDFAQVSPEKGRFRSFLKTVLYHLIADYGRGRKRLKREKSLDEHFVSPDSARSDLAAAADADGEFLASWRDDLLHRCWQKLEEAERQSGKPHYSVLRTKVDQPQLTSDALATAVSAKLEKEISPGNLRVLLHRARDQFADLLIAEVRETLHDDSRDLLEEELIVLDLHKYCRARFSE